MAIVRAQTHVLVQAAQVDLPEDKRLGILMGDLIRSAAQLSVSGPEKHDAVVRGLKQALFSSVADADTMRHWLKRIVPWDGPAGWMADKAIGFVPIEPVVDRLLGSLVEVGYQAMERAGMLRVGEGS